MSTAAFVREAREGDIERIIAIQLDAWRRGYAAAAGPEVRSELDSDEARRAYHDQWRLAITSPPTSAHRVLVATEQREIVGFASVGPAQDTDRWPATDAEIYALHVDAARQRAGHGSRLLNAAVDHLTDCGLRAVYVWVSEEGDPLRGFLEHSGWRPDGARRELDIGEPLALVRLHAAIGDADG